MYAAEHPRLHHPHPPADPHRPHSVRSLRHHPLRPLGQRRHQQPEPDTRLLRHVPPGLLAGSLGTIPGQSLQWRPQVRSLCQSSVIAKQEYSRFIAKIRTSNIRVNYISRCYHTLHVDMPSWTIY